MHAIAIIETKPAKNSTQSGKALVMFGLLTLKMDPVPSTADITRFANERPTMQNPPTFRNLSGINKPRSEPPIMKTSTINQPMCEYSVPDNPEGLRQKR